MILSKSSLSHVLSCNLIYLSHWKYWNPHLLVYWKMVRSFSVCDLEPKKKTKSECRQFYWTPCTVYLTRPRLRRAAAQPPVNVMSCSISCPPPPPPAGAGLIQGIIDQPAGTGHLSAGKSLMIVSCFSSQYHLSNWLRVILPFSQCKAGKAIYRIVGGGF